jgi:integrase
MPSYITAHHGGGWKYQRAIPADLRPMYGRSVIVRYIRRCPRREAEAVAREWAVADAKVLAMCRRTPQDERAGLASFGGVRGLLDNSEIPSSQLDARYAKLPNKEVYWRRIHAEAIIAAGDKGPKLACSWDDLLAQWTRIKEPAVTRGHAATIRLLREHFGEYDCRQLTSSDIAAFRDKLTANGVTLCMVATHLGRVQAMFSAACREPTSPFAGIPNPAVGVRVLGKKPPRKDGNDRTFTPVQVRAILETAAQVRFGGKRHEQVLWALRLLAFNGPRPNEIFQLQGGDVCMSDNGVKFIWVRDIDAVTGKCHLQKRVKTGESRRVPLHPGVMDFFEYAARFAKDEFIFGSFRLNKHNGRAHQLISEFGKFLREDCQIVEPTKRLTLYSLRHAFVTAMRVAGVPKDLRTRVVGHGKDIHDGYGGGDEELPMLAKYVALTKPLG